MLTLIIDCTLDHAAFTCNTTDAPIDDADAKIISVVDGAVQLDTDTAFSGAIRFFV